MPTRRSFLAFLGLAPLAATVANWFGRGRAKAEPVIDADDLVWREVNLNVEPQSGGIDQLILYYDTSVSSFDARALPRSAGTELPADRAEDLMTADDPWYDFDPAGLLAICESAPGESAQRTTVGKSYPVIERNDVLEEFLTVDDNGARIWVPASRFRFVRA